LRGSSGGRLGRWGMWSALGPFAIAARLVPAVCSRLIRSIAYWEMVGGRSSRTPCARVAASAALGSLGDQLPLEGGEAGEQVRDRFFGRRRLEGAVERDQRPSPAGGRSRPGRRGRAARASAGRGWRRRAPACQRPRAAAAAPRSRGASPPRPSGRSPSTSSSSCQRWRLHAAAIAPRCASGPARPLRCRSPLTFLYSRDYLLYRVETRRHFGALVRRVLHVQDGSSKRSRRP
jgi:hypothetical protein